MIPIQISQLRNVTRDIPFDIYLKVAPDNFVHVFSRTTGIDYKRLAQYVQKGVGELFIRAEDKPAFEEFVSKPAHVLFRDPNVPKEKKIAALLNMTEQNMAELFSQLDVTEQTAQDTERVVKGYATLLSENPTTLALMLRLVAHGEYLYYHTIAVSVFSMLIAKGLGKLPQAETETLGFGAFMHDIGLGETELTTEEAERQDHPRAGLKLLEANPTIGREVRSIVYQHHEEPAGTGYPNQLSGPAIYYPAKIVGVADAFSELISRRGERAALPVHEVMRRLFDGAKLGKFDLEIVQTAEKVFLPSISIGKKAA